jgi:ribulose-phosphate 3-epimerase
LSNPPPASPQPRLSLEFSLWSADLARLADEIARVDTYADLYHIDVADAHYVPSLLFFPDLIAALRPLTAKPFHVHLMMDDPRPWIGEFAAAGATVITVHTELEGMVPHLLEDIRSLGCTPGLAIQLETPVERLKPYLNRVDVILMMGTLLGVKSVGLDQQACPRLAATHALLQRSGNLRIHLVADGGIRSETVPALRAAGADGIVPGSLVFKSADLAATVGWLHDL